MCACDLRSGKRCFGPECMFIYPSPVTEEGLDEEYRAYLQRRAKRLQEQAKRRQDSTGKPAFMSFSFERGYFYGPAAPDTLRGKLMPWQR